MSSINKVSLRGLDVVKGTRGTEVLSPRVNAIYLQMQVLIYALKEGGVDLNSTANYHLNTGGEYRFLAMPKRGLQRGFGVWDHNNVGYPHGYYLKIVHQSELRTYAPMFHQIENNRRLEEDCGFGVPAGFLSAYEDPAVDIATLIRLVYPESEELLYHALSVSGVEMKQASLL
jgi:hypothetical protein